MRRDVGGAQLGLKRRGGQRKEKRQGSSNSNQYVLKLPPFEGIGRREGLTWLFRHYLTRDGQERGAAISRLLREMTEKLRKSSSHEGFAARSGNCVLTF